MSEFDVCSGSCETCGSAEDCSKATITLTLDNDETIECSILTIYEAGEREYIALLPLNEQGTNEDGEVYLYRYTQQNGTPILDNIEDDEEYEAASDGFDEWLDSLECIYDILRLASDPKKHPTRQKFCLRDAFLIHPFLPAAAPEIQTAPRVFHTAPAHKTGADDPLRASSPHKTADALLQDLPPSTLSDAESSLH